MAGEDDIVENIKIEGIQQATADLEKQSSIGKSETNASGPKQENC